MYIFRFQAKDGTGAYRHCSFSEHTERTGRPGPGKDFTNETLKEMFHTGHSVWDWENFVGMKIKQSDHYKQLFGFKSLKQAYAWFRKFEVKMMLDKQVELACFEIEDQYVFELGKQIIFNAEKAKKVEV